MKLFRMVIAVAALFAFGWPLAGGAEEGLNDGWHDDAGNIIPAPDGSCPDGYFVYPSPDNGLDHDICAGSPEGDGDDSISAPDPDTGGVYEPVGIAYIVNWDGDGVNCRFDPPNGDVVTILPHGYLVAITAKYVMIDGFGWQQIIFEDNTPNCFVREDFLTDADPGPLVVTDPIVDTTDDDQIGDGAVDEGSDEDLPTEIDVPVDNLDTTDIGDGGATVNGEAVYQLPETGTGPVAVIPVQNQIAGMVFALAIAFGLVGAVIRFLGRRTASGMDRTSDYLER